MRVFISYSRSDEAVAHLLGHILTSHGIQCEIDRKLPAGEPFDVNLRHKIEHADAVLLLLSKSSVSSDWVNQEIGFATAHQKKIYPLSIESQVQPTGMIAAAQSYSLFDWSDTAHTIQRLLATLGQTTCENGGPQHAIGLDRVIGGRVQRTEFLIKQFAELRADAKSRPVICHQAAYSIFATGPNTVDADAPDRSARYERLLQDERKGLEQLIESGVEFKLVLWPKRARRLKERFENLIWWLEQMLTHEKVSYAVIDHAGPNQYIIPGRFCAEGHKLHDKPGYELTVVKYQPDAVTEAVRRFEELFGDAFVDKATTIDQVKERYEQLSRAD